MLGPFALTAAALCTMLLSACAPLSSAVPASPREQAIAPPEASNAATPRLSAEQLTALRGLRDGAARPAGSITAEQVELALSTLSSPDPEIRDGLGYELFARWLGKGDELADDAAARLRDRLVAQLAPVPASPGPGSVARPSLSTPAADDDDAVLRRSFSALVLSVVAARELRAPRWSAAELEAQIAAVARYAASETDLRGHLGARGWAHAAAHTADWVKMLGRHPALSPAQAERLLDALAELVVRRHGYSLHHGEEDRVVPALRSLIDRGALPAPVFERFLTRLAEPIRAGWPTPFDPVLFAAQRNARAVLYALFTSLSLASGPSQAAALAQLRALLVGP